MSGLCPLFLSLIYVYGSFHTNPFVLVKTQNLIEFSFFTSEKFLVSTDRIFQIKA